MEMTKEEKIEILDNVLLCVEHQIYHDDYKKSLQHIFDDNYYGFGIVNIDSVKCDIESVWTDSSNHVNIHVGCPYFEGDLLFDSLFASCQKEVIECIKHKLSSF